MNVLILSLDQSVFNSSATGDSVDRFKAYAGHCALLTVLIPVTNPHEYRTLKNLSLIPVYQKNSLLRYVLFFLTTLKHITQNQVIVANDPILGLFAIIAKKICFTKNKIQINIFGLHTQNRLWLRQSLWHRILNIFHHLAIARADSIRTDNTQDKIDLIRYHKINPQKIVVIPIVPSAKSQIQFLSAKKNSNFKKNLVGQNKLILSVGYLLPNKDFANFIKAAKIVTTVYPKVTFIIAGAGPEKKPLQKLVNDLSIQDYVKLIGSQPYNQLPQLYKNSDMFVLSSYQEGLTRVIMEAALANIPIVSTKVQGSTDLIKHKYSGLIVPCLDSSKLALAIIKLLQHQKLANLYALRAHQFALNYLDFDHNCQLLIQSWKRLSTTL